MELSQLKAVIESLIFASPEPMTPRMLNRLLNDEPKEDVQAALKAVQADYVDRGGLHIAEVAGGFQITTRPDTTNGCGGCSTSDRRRSSRWRRSKRCR